ncbi:MAG: anthranilate phosphoribosyltransferase [Thermoanaerobaculia bacterium]|nr:MAG: anthranilate phosphoribosyltransferase [Thermoanaerobaculia bacterium]
MLARLIAREDLPGAEIEALIGRVVEGRVPDAMVAALLAALAAKGETAEEIAGAARAMRARVRAVPHRCAEVLDTCGTGGDGRGGFNVSTAAAFVAAAGGATVAKHGNRAISSRSGSADVLAALGVRIEVEPEVSARQLETLGIAFLFAPLHHPAMKAVAPVRRALGVRTVFNLLGPLSNPAGASRQLLGVYAADRVEPMARVLAGLGSDHALVVHGRDGLDEITTTAPTLVAEVEGGRVRSFEITAADLGLRPARPEQLVGGSPEENARRLEQVLAGGHGALGDLVAANAGAALYVAGRAGDLRAGVELAQEIIGSGAALVRLEQLRTFPERAEAG